MKKIKITNINKKRVAALGLASYIFVLGSISFGKQIVKIGEQQGDVFKNKVRIERELLNQSGEKTKEIYLETLEQEKKESILKEQITEEAEKEKMIVEEVNKLLEEEQKIKQEEYLQKKYK